MRFLLSGGLLLALACLAPGAGAAVCRVTPSGGGGVDGSDWGANALSLHAALGLPTCTGTGNEIWIAAGVYRTTGDIQSRADSFNIPAGSKLYGGFAGTETLRAERDPQLHRSILSGDILGDDVDDDGDGIIASWEDIVGSNAHHVVSLLSVADVTDPIDPDTVLDGLVITAGKAEDGLVNGASAGAGILCQSSGATARCSPTLANLLVIGNDAVPVPNDSGLNSTGGGLGCLIAGCSPVVEQAHFIGNRAACGGGVGMISGGELNPAISGSRFQGNVAEDSGGGLCLLGLGAAVPSAPTISGTVFVDNHALNTAASPLDSFDYGGGGLFVQYGLGATPLSPVLSDVAFIGNTAGEYGSGGAYLALYVGSPGDLAMSGVSFVDNAAGLQGGAVALQSVAAGDCTAPAGSGHVAVLGNVTFSGNAADRGGALALKTGLNCNNAITLANVTFTGNAATASGGAAIFESGGTAAVPALANAIVWDNAAGDGEQIVLTGPAPLAPVAIGTSIIEGGCPAGTSCTDVSSDDPGLSPLTSYGETTRVHFPDSAGPAIDTGDATTCASAAVGGIDQRGVARPQGAACDIGAVELLPGDVTLDVLVTGQGSVDAAQPPTPSAGGIVGCTATGGSCSATFPAEIALQAPVQLQATSDPGFEVTWGGDCDAGGSVLVDEDRSCTADFVPNTWGVGGSISGLTTTGLALSLSADGGNIFEAVSPGAGSAIFAFATEVPVGADYAVGFLSVPATLACNIGNASGTMPDADVTNVAVSCAPKPLEDAIFDDGFE